jgi:CMP-N-acetylneuraminic acid synthetase
VDIVVLLQPMSPLRTSANIEDALETFHRGDFDSVVSLCPVRENPYWMRTIVDGRVQHLLERDDADYSQRQTLPVIYRVNGAIFVTQRRLLMEEGTILGDAVGPYLMRAEDSIDIDTEADLAEARRIWSERGQGVDHAP